MSRPARLLVELRFIVEEWDVTPAISNKVFDCHVTTRWIVPESKYENMLASEKRAELRNQRSLEMSSDYFLGYHGEIKWTGKWKVNGWASPPMVGAPKE